MVEEKRVGIMDYSIIDEIALIKEQNKKPSREMLDKRDKILIKLFNEGKSYKELVELFGLTARGIRYIVRGYNLAPRKGNEKYCINKDFFKVWTKDMAWVLGMIYSDGHIVEDKAFSISQKDANILEIIRNLLDSNHPFTGGDKTKLYTFCIGSKEMVKDLINHGLTPKKSLTLKFPYVPEEFLSHFIRGIIDGDGWVKKEGSVMNVTSGSKDFAESLESIFLSWGLNSEIRTQVTKKGTKIYRVWVVGIYSVWKLSTIIYKDCNNLFVKPKREKMIQHHKRVSSVTSELEQLKDFKEIKYFLMRKTKY